MVWQSDIAHAKLGKGEPTERRGGAGANSQGASGWLCFEIVVFWLPHHPQVGMCACHRTCLSYEEERSTYAYNYDDVCLN